MANNSNQSGETPIVLAVTALAGIVGLLLVVQLIRAQPMDLPSMLIIAVCFVVAVIVTAMWGRRGV